MSRNDLDLDPHARRRWVDELARLLPQGHGSNKALAEKALGKQAGPGQVKGFADKLGGLREGKPRGLTWFFNTPVNANRLESALGLEEGYLAGLMHRCRSAGSDQSALFLLPGFPELGHRTLADVWAEPNLRFDREDPSTFFKPLPPISLEQFLVQPGLKVVVAPSGAGVTTLLRHAADLLEAEGWHPRWFDGEASAVGRGDVLLVDGLAGDWSADQREALEQWAAHWTDGPGYDNRPAIVALAPGQDWPRWLPPVARDEPEQLHSAKGLEFLPPDRATLDRFLDRLDVEVPAPLTRRYRRFRSEPLATEWDDLLGWFTSMEELGWALRDAIEQDSRLPRLDHLLERAIADGAVRLRFAGRDAEAATLSTAGANLLRGAATRALQAGAINPLGDDLLRTAGLEELDAALQEAPPDVARRLRALLPPVSADRLEQALDGGRLARRSGDSLVMRHPGPLLATVHGCGGAGGVSHLLRTEGADLAIKHACDRLPGQTHLALARLDGEALLLSLQQACRAAREIAPEDLGPQVIDTLAAALLVAAPGGGEKATPLELDDEAWSGAVDELAMAWDAAGVAPLDPDAIQREYGRLARQVGAAERWTDQDSELLCAAVGPPADLLVDPDFWDRALRRGGAGEAWMRRFRTRFFRVFSRRFWMDALALRLLVDPGHLVGRVFCRTSNDLYSSHKLLRVTFEQLGELDERAILPAVATWLAFEWDPADHDQHPDWFEGEVARVDLDDLASMGVKSVRTPEVRRELQQSLRDAVRDRGITALSSKRALELAFEPAELTDLFRSPPFRKYIGSELAVLFGEAGLPAAEVLRSLPLAADWPVPPRRKDGQQLLHAARPHRKRTRWLLEHASADEVTELLQERWRTPWPPIDSDDPVPPAESWPDGTAGYRSGRLVLWRYLQAGRPELLAALAPGKTAGLPHPDERTHVVAALARVLDEEQPVPGWVVEAAVRGGAETSQLSTWTIRQLETDDPDGSLLASVLPAVLQRDDAPARELAVELTGQPRLLAALVVAVPEPHEVWTALGALGAARLLAAATGLGDPAAAQAQGLLAGVMEALDFDAIAALLDQGGGLATSALAALQAPLSPLGPRMRRYLETLPTPPTAELRAWLLDLQDRRWLEALETASASWRPQERRDAWLALAREAGSSSLQKAALRRTLTR